ncbi:hypothetical protein TrST_g7541 [Triparma strigata]|uniref:PPIase cyclophilin-type domain-containing protein n=1 Tax=Triparma strigata TaxID=1606541 RepID=A0A9W7A0E6_9STRA|nr:hypothetical protein TrST_g7541 [Triparma strigata]
MTTMKISTQISTQILLALLLLLLNIHYSTTYNLSSPSPARRDFISKSTLILSPLLTFPSSSTALEEALESPSPKPTITKKVYFDVRISRSDGTFAVRDNDSADPVLRSTLILGLYGNDFPVHVERFLSYVDVKNDGPSYANSYFTGLDPVTGSVEGGRIKGLEVANFNNQAVLNYGGQIVKSELWLEDGSKEKFKHDREFLITHRDLDVSPKFGITTTASAALDGTNTVFGELLEGFDFVRRCEFIQKYSVSTSTEEPGSLKDEVFTMQKEFFRGLAKGVGDSRLDELYEGKFLRKVDVTRCGLL